MIRTPRRRPARRARFVVAAVLPLLAMAACAEEESKADEQDAEAAIADAPEGTFAGQKASGEPVKVGLINPEGGPHINQPEGRVAAEAAVEYANEHLGGLGGRPIELSVCKSKEDPASTTDCANQMVQDGVVGVVVANTGAGGSMVPILTEAGIAYTSYQGASAEEIGTPGTFLWTGGLPASMIAMATSAAQNGTEAFTLFVTDSSSVVASVSAIAEPVFEGAGVDLTVTPVPVGTPDASPQVSAGLEGNPGTVAVVGDAAMCTATLKALQTIGTDATRIIIQPCMDPSVYEAVPTMVDGSLLSTGTDGTSDGDEARAYRAVMAEYAPGETNSGAAQTGYQSMLTFIRAVNAGIEGEPTASSVMDALGAAKDVPIAVGGGATATCDGAQIEGMPGFCSSGALIGEVVEGTVTSFEVVG